MLATAAVLLQIAIITGPKACETRALPSNAPPDTVCSGVTAIGIGGVGSGRKRPGTAHRVIVTDAHRATAYRDAAARELLLRARSARLRQDSALTGYDAFTFQRFALGLSVSDRTPQRNLVAYENASRVRWQRERGIVVDVQGARITSGMVPRASLDENEAALSASIPYHPGRDELWIGTGVVATEVDERDVVHPMAEGAEAYYVYESGDTASIRVGTSVIHIRELRIRPRIAAWNRVVGSLWFDDDRGTLVRAAFRFAAPFDLMVNLRDVDSAAANELARSAPRIVRPFIPSVRGQMQAVTIEYGLYAGRFWLPRVRSADGFVQLSLARLPYRLEERFRYDAVNGTDSLAGTPPIVVPAEILPTVANMPRLDSLDAALRVRRDSVTRGLLPAGRADDPACDTSASYTRTQFAADGATPMLLRVPCDQRQLATSRALPPLGAREAITRTDADAHAALVAQAMSMRAQPLFAPQRPTLDVGAGLLRYNRIEGLSIGAAVHEPLGAGYSARVVGRVGVADRIPNADVSLERSDLQHRWAVSGYRALGAVGDDSPLTAGSSLGALLFGRDEGYYYRRTGLAFTGSVTSLEGTSLTALRLFVDHQQPARTNATFSFGRPMRDSNITAVRGSYAGATFDASRTLGGAVTGTRLISTVQLEGAVTHASGDRGYGRASLQFTLSQSSGAFSGLIQVAGGQSVGQLPVQRAWYLGGTRTLPGLSFGTAGGDAFWLARAEVGTGIPLVRPVLFGDLGWAGARTDWQRGYRPLSDVGVGVRILDGLLRVDAARGIYPVSRTRLSLSLERRF
jgi:hypothetical protein